MFANARKTLANNQRQNGKENRQNAKPLRSAANNGATSGAGTFLQHIGPAEQKFAIFYDSDVEVRKQDRNQDGKGQDQLLLDKENKVFESKPETGAIPKRKNQTGLAVRGPQVRTNVAPPKPARKDKASAENLAPKQDVNIVDEESPKKASLSAENTPADYLLTEQERSSTCGISSQMKGIELTSAGGPIKKYVQVPFADLDISGKKQPSNRRPSSSSFSSNEKDSEDDKENDRVVPAEDISPPAYESQGADGLPTNCFAVPRPSVDKARVALYKLQEDEMCKVKEYSDDIFKYLREQEKLYLPRPGYMANQPDLLPHMRCMLVDWLVEVAMEYKLSEACLFMAVSYVDRFLSYNKIYRTKLQLLGTTAMFIAAKVEEIYPPESEEFVFITDNTYTKEQVLKMETFILMALDFRMTCVTPFTFYSKFVLDTDVPESVAFLALYLLELVMMEGGDILNFLPSIQAASALALASHALMFSAEWRTQFSKATGYTLAELAPCMSTMKIIWAKAANHDQQAVRQKYLEAKYKMVANTPVCLALPEDRRRP